MTDSDFLDVSTESILSLLAETEKLFQNGYPSTTSEDTPLVAGTLFQNEGRYEMGISEAAIGRLGGAVSHFTWPKTFTLSMQEQVDELNAIGSAIDILLSAQVSEETFGNGRSLTERMAAETPVDLINLHDDIYAHQSAMAVLSGFRSRLGELEGKNIAISWGFGSRFVLPTTAHSLLLLATKLGSDIQVVAPPKFSLLRRVHRDAEEIAKKSGSEVEEINEFDGAFVNTDAVFALNWGSFDNFNHPERNSSDAQEFRDWYFTTRTISEDCLFMTEPPIRREMLTKPDLLKSEKNITDEWLARRVAILVSTIRLLQRTDTDEKPTTIT